MKEAKRRYRMRRRAESQETTRQRIVEATMRLHEEVGPRNTSISAIAERAGVQRLTVYRHFPDENAVFQACTAHWLALNPPPAPTAWSAIADPRKRLRAAIGAFHAYYARTWRMWTVAFRDVSEVPALQPPMAEFARFVDGVAEDVIAAFGQAGNAAMAATIRHALRFPAWADLQDQGLDADAKLALVMAWLRGARRQ